jgi:hypothetical protein
MDSKVSQLAVANNAPVLPHTTNVRKPLERSVAEWLADLRAPIVALYNDSTTGFRELSEGVNSLSSVYHNVALDQAMLVQMTVNAYIKAATPEGANPVKVLPTEWPKISRAINRWMDEDKTIRSRKDRREEAVTKALAALPAAAE